MAGVAYAQDVSVTLGDLPEGKTVRIKFQGQVVSPIPVGDFDAANQGLVTGTGFSVVTDDPGTGAPNDPTVTLLIQPPTVGKLFGSDPLPLGQTTSLTFTLANPNATVALGGISLSDSLPAGLEVANPANATNTCGGVLNAAPGATLISISSVAIPAASNCAFSVDVLATSPGLKVNVTGNIQSVDAGPGLTATDDVTVTVPDLTIAKSHVMQFMQGDTGREFTIVVTNSGTANTVGTVTVTDVVPSGLTPTAAVGAGWVCGIVAQTVTCDRSDALAPSTSYAPITLTVTVSQTATGTITNTATVSGGGELDTSNNSSSDGVSIVPAPATHFTLDTPLSVTESVAFNFTVTARNVFGNPVPTYTGTVGFTSSDAQAVLPAPATLTSGVGTFAATLKTLGNQTITATDTVTLTITGTSNPIVVLPEQDGKVLDFQGDVMADLLWRNKATGQVYIWKMNGTTPLTNEFVANVPDLNWRIAGGADFNSDTRGDLLWHHRTTGQSAIWLMNGATFTSSVLPAATDTNWQMAGTGDVDGDGDPDIFWRNLTTGQAWVWRMAGATPIDYKPIATVGDFNWQIQGIRDFNGDGRSDMIWRNRATGQVYFWLMDWPASSSFPVPSPVPVTTVADLNWTIVCGGDFNGDGRSDLIWHNIATGQVYVWYMNGGTILNTLPITTVGDLNWKIIASGDFNANGRADLLWHHRVTGQVSVWLMDGNTITASGVAGTVADLNWALQGLR
jgi:uncharacterized repeat protein (TIGR01451 family)